MNPSSLTNALGISGQNRTDQVGALQNFQKKFSLVKQQPGLYTPAPTQQTSTGASIPNTPTTKNMSPASGATYKGVAIDTTQGDAYVQQQMANIDAPKPGYNPMSVDIKIDPTIPSDAMNTVGSPTTVSEGRKSKQTNVLKSKYAREEEKLLKDIASLNTGIAGLKSTQASELSTAKQNPGGMFGPNALSSTLGRLTEAQALELNARTGQLNAYLDNLELYQGYRPQMVGTPQIDDATGEAFAYIQDPQTGQVTAQSLGVVASPAAADGFTLSSGQIRYDAQGNPIAYGGDVDSLGTGAGSFDRGLVDWEDPTTIDSLPVSSLTKAIMAGTGSMKDLTPTAKKTVLEEMYKVGYNPNQVINTKLEQLVSLWEAMPEDQKGLVQGAKFWAENTVPEVAAFNSAKTLLNRQVARLYDVGVLSDQDVSDYKKAMPSRFDSDINVVNAKLEGIMQASTGKSATKQSTQEGTIATLDDGRKVLYQGGKWVDPYTLREVTDIE